MAALQRLGRPFAKLMKKNIAKSIRKLKLGIQVRKLIWETQRINNEILEDLRVSVSAAVKSKTESNGCLTISLATCGRFSTAFSSTP